MRLKYLLLPIISIALLLGCTQKQTGNTSPQSQKKYHPVLAKILEAHGGIEKWNAQQTLSFKLNDQTHTIDLNTREIKITSAAFSMGNDDGTVWIKQDSFAFKGSPTFYHSLMFYFHTMPFVFADDGINYEEAPGKAFKGVDYKALKIWFDENIGDAPKDEYILYYHPDTYKMEWLAYTSTYRTQQKSDHFGLIHYKTWKRTDGFLLPTELQWHQYENGEVGEARGPARVFNDVNISEEKMGDDYYAMPEGAKVDSTGTN